MIIVGAVACQSGGNPPAPGPSQSTAGPTTPADLTAVAAAKARSLSAEDLAGQVLMPYAYGYAATDVSSGAATANRSLAGVDTPAEMIAKYHLGGLILVDFVTGDVTGGTNPTSNIADPDQVRQLTAGLQDAARRLPAGADLLIGTDQEYGVVTRIRQGPVQLPSALALGAGHTPATTQAAWAAAGSDLRALGINVDFAPDADVLGSGGGIIGSRSFGSDPAQVSAQSAAAVTGLQSAGVAATLKHFPGHGHTTSDSHSGLPVLAQSRASLEANDLPPFTAGIAAGSMLVMSGHLDVRSIDPGVPSSFSSKVLIDLLRTKMGFKGVVVTDAMNMAPAKRWPPGESAVRALNAGNDLLLMPPDIDKAYRAILDGLATGELPKERLVEAVTRILALKLRLATAPPAAGALNGPAQHAAALAAAAAAITVLKGSCTGVPGALRVTASGGRGQQVTWLSDALKALGVRVVTSGGTEVHLIGYGDGTGDLSPSAAVTVAMDTPYLLRRSTSEILLATYSSAQVSMEALASYLAGKAAAPGRSPVAVSGLPRTACP
jgi:beta-N-acetylhexosaminidase